MSGLVFFFLVLLLLWAAVCGIGMALCALPYVLYYGVVGAGYGLLWTFWGIVRGVESLASFLSRRRAFRRELRWSVRRQKEAQRRIAELFAAAGMQMEHVSVGR